MRFVCSPLILTCIIQIIRELELKLCPWNYEYQIVNGAEEDFCTVGVCILIHDHLYVGFMLMQSHIPYSNSLRPQ